MNAQVLVLNQNYEPLNICNVRRALVLVIMGKAEVLEMDGLVLHTIDREYRAPSVIRLSALVKRPRPQVKLTRREFLDAHHERTGSDSAQVVTSLAARHGVRFAGIQLAVIVGVDVDAIAGKREHGGGRV